MGQAAYDSVSSRFYDLDGDKLAEDVCKLAMESVDTKSVETNDYDVVLDYYAATGLLSTFLAAFNGENVQRRRSILHDKMNSEIVSPNLSITNDATLEKGMYSAKCDGEGTVSKKTNLVENGVLKSYMCDRYYGKLLGMESILLILLVRLAVQLRSTAMFLREKVLSFILKV